MELNHRRLSNNSNNNSNNNSGASISSSNSNTMNSSSSNGGGGGGGGGGGSGGSVGVGGGGGGGREINIAVLGSRGVGKSAIIVRYLTRRFIGDYDPKMDAIFTHTAMVDSKHVLLHIWDTAWHLHYNTTTNTTTNTTPTTPTTTTTTTSTTTSGALDPTEDPTVWADGVLLVFSLTDPQTWACVQDLVTRLRQTREDDRFPVAIAANKADLIHLRRLDSQDCALWAAQHGCVYREVSAGEEPDSVEEVFRCLCRHVRSGSSGGGSGGGGGSGSGSGGSGAHKKREKLSRVMQKPAVAARVQIRQSLRNLAGRTWRSRTSTF